MKYLKISKKCPFCPKAHYAYIFRTYAGLYRHVFRWHALTEDKRWCHENTDETVAVIRVYITKFRHYKDIEINGIGHLEALLERYALGKINPSLRVDKALEEFLDEEKTK